MNRLWAITLATAVLVGCRSSQPATNPFLRTTVPPPGTGQAAVTVPSEPYYSGTTAPPGTLPTAAPSIITSPPPPVVTAPPIVAPPPAMAPPPAVAPPPMVAPPRSKYDPPGGSFQYNQSSLQNPNSASRVAAQAVPPTANGIVTAGYNQPLAQSPVAASGEPIGTPGHQIRIVSGNSGGDAASLVADGVAASTDGNAPATDLAATQGDDGATAAQTNPVTTVSYTARGQADEAATDDWVDDGRADSPANYAHAKDYSTLRGRLEYSPTSRKWKLRYIPIDGQSDFHGGSVVLSDSPLLASFKPGDVVAARGSLSGKPQNSGGFAPLYQLSQIEAAPR